MSFETPTLAEIVSRVLADIKSTLKARSLLPRSIARAVGVAVAGTAFLLHKHIRFVSRQIFPSTAEKQFVELWAKIFGIFRKAPTFSEYQVEFVGTDGIVIPKDTALKRSDGVEYLTLEAVTIASGIALVNVRSAVAGSNPNLLVDDQIQLGSAIIGVDEDAVVRAEILEGEDQENDEGVQKRLVKRIQTPGGGGQISDYEGFALSVAGVTRAWVLPRHLGNNNVAVTFVEDNDDPIIPGPAKVQEVQDVLDQKAPILDDALAFAPTSTPIDFTIAIRPNTVEVQNAVTEQLKDLIRREGNVRGAFKQVGETHQGTLALSKIKESISISEGEEDHNLISPSTRPQAVTGGILTLGAITWQTL